ncbi:MAG: hypothetical protein WBQ89_03620 [Candidatus Acidiferrum sp.]
MKRASLSLLLAILICMLAVPSQAQTIPPVKALALDDTEVILPKPGGQQLLILVLGFSHKSGDACRVWAKRVASDYTSDPLATYYQLAELQSAPSMVRGLILHGMRKDVPAPQHSHFVPLFDHEVEWKKAVNFSALDDPYILIAAPDGHILWQTHGPVSDSAYADFKSAVAKIVANPKAP